MGRPVELDHTQGNWRPAWSGRRTTSRAAQDKLDRVGAALDDALNVPQGVPSVVQALANAMSEAHAAEEAGRPEEIAEAARRVDVLLTMARKRQRPE